MTTRIYGASDDLIEFEGDVRGEVGAYMTDAEHATVFVSDGTVLRVTYGDDANRGIWKIVVVEKGSLFDTVVTCTDEDADPHSDEAFFKDGLKWAYVAKSAERAS